MDRRLFKSDAILLLAAMIWGTAFVAQRVGMDYVGPFTFNGIRFALGALVLIPFILRNNTATAVPKPFIDKTIMGRGLLAGTVLFTGASLQQVGLVYTTAGNAGFITGLYVVIVPMLGLLWGHHTHSGTWIGVGLAALGLYFLSITKGFTIAFGDLLELIGAFFWAGHVLIIAWLSPQTDNLKLAFAQFWACALLSLMTAVIFEEISIQGVLGAAFPIFYGGAVSVGIAYTLQVIGQRDAHPAHAAIVLSMEAVVAAAGGWLILGESLTPRGIFGCALMLTGMILSQLSGIWKDRQRF